MTKLTQQEIEQEQEKFEKNFIEKWDREVANHPLKEKMKNYLLLKANGIGFVDIDVRNMFINWLARAELTKSESQSSNDQANK